jgi:transcriptional regulator with XRE-family HTH domain
MRGIYRRVAERLGVDPSYVSRVARGERKSRKIEAALNREVSKVLTIATQRAKVAKK